MFGLISSFLSNIQLWVVLDGNSLQECSVNAGISHGSILSPTLFLIYITAIYADDATLNTKCEQASDLWQQLDSASELESDLINTVAWIKKWLVDLNAVKAELALFEQSNICLWC